MLWSAISLVLYGYLVYFVLDIIFDISGDRERYRIETGKEDKYKYY